MKDKLQIRDVTRATGIDRETLRFYEQKGLLPKAARTESGYRLFDPDVVDRIKFIKLAQDVGFSLKEILGLLQLGEKKGGTVEDLRSIADQKIKSIDERIQSLQKMRLVLTNLSKTALKVTKGSKCPILSQFKNLEL